MMMLPSQITSSLTTSFVFNSVPLSLHLLGHAEHNRTRHGQLSPTLRRLRFCTGSAFLSSCNPFSPPQRSTSTQQRWMHSNPDVKPVKAQLLQPGSMDGSSQSRDVPEQILRAVERLARQPRITVPDVAAAAGVNMLTARDALVTLANITGAAIDVSADGELAYRFPRDVRRVLRQKSMKAALRMAWEKAFPSIYRLVRIGFGAFLIVSLVITFVAIAVISSSARSDDERNRSSSRGAFGGGGGSGGSMFFGPRIFGPNIFDVVFYSRGVDSGAYYDQRGRVMRKPAKPSGQMSFLESIYSFVFGDGNPDEDMLRTKRWRKVAAVIRANRGAVVAEQLAPYLDLPHDYLGNSGVGSDSSRGTNPSAIIDESFMMPVLERFHGHPEVTDDGNLIYVFPDLGVTGSSGGAGFSVDVVGASSTAAVRETELKLSGASTSQQLIAGALGALNIGGAFVLGSMLRTVPMVGGASSAVGGYIVNVGVSGSTASFLSLVRGVYPALLVYALTYAVVPFVRFLWQRKKNAEIRGRNGARERAAMELARPSAVLRAKLRQAYDWGQEARVVAADSVVYSTDTDFVEQQAALERQASEDFDLRLEKRSRENVNAGTED